MKLDVVLKWIATVILIVGSFVNAVGIYPLGPILLLAGGFVWLVVSFLWKEPAMIITNLVAFAAGSAGLAYTLIKLP